ncbi:maltose O-acetyltransferase [Gelidibacter sediminis]|uniref:Maltose O-acetyltransferase n=1 Tax=Gelidibacter sediminis TaxID=1608710 RepID=A0A4R7PX34_9FLAO|nr:acyltransferase [Gelidibacter sediminis]TDU39513.1 maltose O-acetyltransferase [Gelidibacter sediminis]
MMKAFKLKLVAAVHYFRKLFYRWASTNERISGTFRDIQPVICKGNGSIRFGTNVKFGVANSPMFYNTYAYIEARTEQSAITFGNNVSINNQFTVVSEDAITIGDDVLIGLNCTIYDSNFHDLGIANRNQPDPTPRSVNIANNVFIGNNVTILKGVSIGENSIVAAGSIVTESFPANVVIGGNPAKLLRTLA